MAVDPARFAGNPAIAAFATSLASCASSRLAERRARGQAVAARADFLADPANLERDFADTIRAAHGRQGSRCRFNTIARGWMNGRREEVDFQTLGAGGRWLDLGTLLPPPGNDQLEPLDGAPGDVPVQPLMNRLLRELRSRSSDFTRANNYSRTHGGGSHKGRGLSVDLYMRGPLDERGFYQRERAAVMLLALDGAANAVGAEWRVLYNDFSVAAAINRHTGIRRVVFVGHTRPGGTNLNWHGPLILHFHLDIAPKRS